ncbi:VWA domain-containing protein [Marivita sp. S6314]|uniref:nitric oxide reductase activation protein NorD n=1 Tax=Marivita sp. S6314 TaxID=2926406 RepID=UPI001FF679C6|nr:VWA domain-containing protein [Marivita sp. S6314]MCK0150468.1 VWA domain-containing protein [Marivita sp. S6314]
MSDAIEPWEPEETVGKLWHRWASHFDAPDVHHPDAGVHLEDEIARLAVLFRGLGGDASVELRPVAAETSHHRLSFRRKLGTWAEQVPRASFDGAILRLPITLDLFPDAALNRALYTWLTACAAHVPVIPRATADPMAADLTDLHSGQEMILQTLTNCPGFADIYATLRDAHLATRPRNALPRAEAGVEAMARFVLGEGDAPKLPSGPASRRYLPMRPVPLWPRLIPHVGNPLQATETPPEAEANLDEETLETTKKGTRKVSDQTERNDSLILHKFEAILSFADFLNLNRRTDDDDLDAAKKAMDDLDELSLTDISKAPATKFKLNLDLSPADVNREAISGQHTYDEWDVKTKSYLPNHCCVFASDTEAADAPAPQDARAARRIRNVRRQFEAFRPRPVTLKAQPDGDTLDLSSVIRARADLAATGSAQDRLWCQTRPTARDLAVSILIDTSRSTESAVTGRAVIDIEREALTALAWGLNACGDPLAIHAFSSLRRDRVYVERCKDFDEPMSEHVECKLANLKPGFYTRVGAAIRHVSADLQTTPQASKLLIVLTDGKPNDIDHYEGRHGIEDTRMAVREARRQGQSVFGITVDPKGQSWFPRLFGPGGYAVIAQPEHLTTTLPALYRQLIGDGG